MRMIHCADIHLDSKMESNLSKEQARERKNELLMTFLRMVNYAREHEVAAILIAGDLFDTARVTKKTKHVIMDCMEEHPEIDFLYLPGNHDDINFIEELEGIPNNLKLFHTQWSQYEYEKVVVSGIQLTTENANKIYQTLALEEEKINIVMLHGQESRYDSREDAELIFLNQLRDKSIDYLALGHIHSYKEEILDDRGTYCYCGCLEGRGFDECGEKGFVLLDICESNVNATFVPFAKRNLYEVSVDISGLNRTGAVLQAIQERCGNIKSSSIVKVVLEGSVGVDSERDLEFLVQNLADQFYFIKIEDKTRLDIHKEDYQYDISLKGEFVRQVLESGLSEEEQNQIIQYGLNALSGEAVE